METSHNFELSLYIIARASKQLSGTLVPRYDGAASRRTILNSLALYRCPLINFIILPRLID